jgi:DNA-binding response OmpR family regulator
MNEAEVRHTKNLLLTESQCPTSPPPRILVVDDEACMRGLNAEILVKAGYHVDAAEDGAAAWDILQTKGYDLLITDNSMPMVSGVELIAKVRAARMALPVIMATGTVPEHEFSRHPQIQPNAILLKPYTAVEFLKTVSGILRTTAAAVIVILLLCRPPVINAQGAKEIQDSTVKPNAVTLSVHGTCDYSDDGGTFTKFERGHIFEQNVILRTGDNARADLFFRRTGITVRLQPDTEIKLEKMSVKVKGGLPVVSTLLDLRTGRIFTVVRSAISGATFEIRNAAGRCALEGSGVGRYIITANGTHVSAIGSVIPLKVIGETGVTVVAAGQQFTRKDGKTLPLASSLYVKDLIELDEIQAAAETARSQEIPPQP